MLRFTGWFLWGAVVAAMLSALLGISPDRARPLLLAPVLFGAAVGFMLGRLAGQMSIVRRLPVAVAVGLLVIAGLLNAARITYDRLADTARQNVQEDPQQLIALQLLQSEANRDPTMRPRYRERRLALAPTFGDYLAGRLLFFGWIPAPWPAVFWSGEIAMAAAMGIMIALRNLPTGLPESPPSPSPDVPL